jgi:hypothetical protein
MLYTITSPFVVRTASSLTLYTVLTYFLLVLFAAVMFIPVGCLTHSYFRRSIAPAAPPSAGVHQPAGKDHVVGV